MRRIFISLLIFPVIGYLPAFGEVEGDAAKEVGEVLGIRKVESKDSENRDEKNLERKIPKKKKGKGKVIKPADDDVVLTLDRTQKEDVEDVENEDE